MCVEHQASSLELWSSSFGCGPSSFEPGASSLGPRAAGTTLHLSATAGTIWMSCGSKLRTPNSHMTCQNACNQVPSPVHLRHWAFGPYCPPVLIVHMICSGLQQVHRSPGLIAKGPSQNIRRTTGTAAEASQLGVHASKTSRHVSNRAARRLRAGGQLPLAQAKA